MSPLLPVKNNSMTHSSEKLSDIKLGVASVTYNAEKFLLPFLECVFKQTLEDFEFLVIDNQSSDRTAHILKSLQKPNLYTIFNDANVGYAEACNMAIQHFVTKSVDVVLLINNDTIFEANLFKDLLITQKLYNADAITPRICFAGDGKSNWYAGGRFTFWKGFQGEHLGIGKVHDHSDVIPQWMPVAPGCCVMFDLDVFKKIGLFDPDYFFYFEDTDMFIRMKRKGLRLLYDPSITILHKVSLSTGGSQSNISIRYYQRNQIYLLRKHFGTGIVFIQTLIILTKAVLRFIFGKDNWQQFKLRIRSFREGVKMPIRTQEVTLHNEPYYL